MSETLAQVNVRGHTCDPHRSACRLELCSVHPDLFLCRQEPGLGEGVTAYMGRGSAGARDPGAGRSGFLQLPEWLGGKESACQCRRLGVSPWVKKIPWRRKWQPTPVSLPGASHRQRSLEDYSP